MNVVEISIKAMQNDVYLHYNKSSMAWSGHEIRRIEIP
jgi:hypothetical protein